MAYVEGGPLALPLLGVATGVRARLGEVGHSSGAGTSGIRSWWSRPSSGIWKFAVR